LIRHLANIRRFTAFLGREAHTFGRKRLVPVCTRKEACAALNPNTYRKGENQKMDNARRITELGQPHTTNGQNREMVIRPDAEAAAQRRPDAQLITPIPVSRSSYLNEKDRHYRAAETMDNGADLAVRGMDHLLDLDRKRREAPADAPLVQAGMEQFVMTYISGARMVVSDFLNRPYERW
jgi:hypothetical protein